MSACLRADKIPPTPLVESIAVAKVKAVEDTIALCFRLKQDVGSFALMGGSGFEQARPAYPWHRVPGKFCR